MDERKEEYQVCNTPRYCEEIRKDDLAYRLEMNLNELNGKFQFYKRKLEELRKSCLHKFHLSYKKENIKHHVCIYCGEVLVKIMIEGEEDFKKYSEENCYE